MDERPGRLAKPRTYASPVRDPRGLRLYGPRLKLTIGPPLLLGSPASPPTGVETSCRSKFVETDALIDTGAQRTVVSPEVVERVGLSKINEASLRVAGGIVKADVYVASLQFPRCGFSAIEVMEVSCCDLPQPYYRCLIGLSRWTFVYDGPVGTWHIEERGGTPWVDPPEGIDFGFWGK